MQDDNATTLQKILQRSGQDQAFRQRLVADPGAVLRAEGLDLPAGVQVRALENRPGLLHLVLPHRPADLDDAALDEIAGGRQASVSQLLRGWSNIKPSRLF